MSCSDSEKLKIQKKFSKKLILEAYNANYEPQEIASLVDIVLSLLNLESDEVLSFVVKCGICDPLVLGSIKNAEFSSSQIIDIMLAQGKDQFLINIEEAFEQHLLSLKDQDTREYVSRFLTFTLLSVVLNAHIHLSPAVATRAHF